MQHLIEHLIANNFEEILDRSLLNCHVHGLHSIMLLESPGKTIRLYITDSDHQMSQLGDLAYHPHHCNLTLHCILGTMQNVIIEPIKFRDSRVSHIVLDRFEYQSKIKEDVGGFKLKGWNEFHEPVINYMMEGSVEFMKAEDIHTVIVPEGEVAAWFVYEGMEDKEYQPNAWSNKDLSQYSTEGLYLKPTRQDLKRLFLKIGIEI